MNALKQIVVATDLSAHAEVAVARGAVLARQHGAELHLVHVSPQFSVKEMSESYRPYQIRVEDQTRWVDAARAQLHALADSVSKEFGLAVREHALLGNASSAIDAFVRPLPADLLVVGTHGEGFLRERLLGSTAFALVQRAVCPALVVKTENRQVYANVLVGIDLMSVGQRALEVARRLAPHAQTVAAFAVRLPYDGVFNALSAAAPDQIEASRQQLVDAAQQELDAFIGASDTARHIARIAEYGHAAHVLVSRAEATHADLIVVGKHASSTGEARFGGVAKRIAEAADCDVLVVP
jgi:nucleotide-binding universal stress UspA family protein